jgi:flagellar hook-length control protein FliK
MRIEFQTDRLGNVQLHARVAGDEVGAAIAVEKRDAHAAIAVELPALQQALSAKQLRVDNVILSQGSLGSPSGDAGRNPQQQPSTTHRYSNNPSWTAAPKYLSAGRPDAPLSGIFDTQGRLNVHA